MDRLKRLFHNDLKVMVDERNQNNDPGSLSLYNLFRPKATTHIPEKATTHIPEKATTHIP
jgi:hypothetical protein